MTATESRYYSPKAFTKILYDMAYMVVKHKKQLKLISKKFKSDIMLAVTYVNGCRLCSYYHTQVLLKEGATNEELTPLLDGSFMDLDTEESTALVFAQHYADSRGDYDPEAYRALEKQYGEEMAVGILATVKMIMFGNVNGIALGNLWDRLRFKKVKNSNLPTELYNAFSPVVLLPTFMIAGILRKRLEL